MNATVTIIPYGSLRRNIPLTDGNRLDQPIAGARSLAEILVAIGVSAEDVQLAMVNHRAAVVETCIRAGDRIALFPREYPIFVDWQAYRHP